MCWIFYLEGGRILSQSSTRPHHHSRVMNKSKQILELLDIDSLISLFIFQILDFHIFIDKSGSSLSKDRNSIVTHQLNWLPNIEQTKNVDTKINVRSLVHLWMEEEESGWSTLDKRSSRKFSEHESLPPTPQPLKSRFSPKNLKGTLNYVLFRSKRDALLSTIQDKKSHEDYDGMWKEFKILFKHSLVKPLKNIRVLGSLSKYKRTKKPKVIFTTKEIDPQNKCNSQTSTVDSFRSKLKESKQ